MNQSLAGKKVLITGVGLKDVRHVFRDVLSGEPSHTSVLVEGIEYKANIGAATALACARAGAETVIVARSEGCLRAVIQWIKREVPDASVRYGLYDLANKRALKDLVAYVNAFSTDKRLYWVQSLGLGAGTVTVPGDNPYQLIGNISADLISAELSVLTSTVGLLQHLLPYFKKQEESRVCIVSSMSAIRSFASGGIHNAAKGALSRFANAAAIELAPKGIYVTDIRPGAVDTGLYDSEEVQNAVANIAAQYGTDWSKRNGGLRLMPPLAVGKAIVTALTSEAHITSINMVARGQWPHEGS